MFDSSSGWTLLAAAVTFTVIVASIAFVWRARAAARRGAGVSALDGLAAFGASLVALGIIFGDDRVTEYSFMGAGVVIAVLWAVLRLRMSGR